MIKSIFTIATLLLFISCAAIQSPPGGPKDETPPELIETIPANGTVLFEGGKVELIFTEYIDEKTVNNAIRVLPTFDPMPDVIYKGRRVFINMPDSLEKNQTYIISINRELKDEHKVPLAQGIHVAFATGDKIDDGEISGTVFYENSSTIHLWRIQPGETDSSIIRAPDYLVDAADDGTFSFQYLSNGTYRLVGVDRSAAGGILSPERMKYGVPWVNTIELTTDGNSIQNIDLMIPDSRAAIKMSTVEWNHHNWGTITFSDSISHIISKVDINATNKDSTNIPLKTFLNPMDNTQLHFLVPEDSIKSEYYIETTDLIEGLNEVLKKGQIKVSVDTTQDTTYLLMVHPQKNYELRVDEDKIKPLALHFNRLIMPDSIHTFLTLKKDSLLIDYKAHWLSPISLELLPIENWLPKSTYTIEIFRDSIQPKFGRSFKDSINTISIKTSQYQGYGNLLGSIEKDDLDNINVKLISMEKEPRQFRTVVNSGGTFNMNRIPEGNYSLLLFQDTDRNNQYSYGRVLPIQPSEWFYHYPDTVKIRTNWDLELSQIKLEHHP